MSETEKETDTFSFFSINACNESIFFKTLGSLSVNNFNQEKNLIDTIKQNCRKIVKDKTGKKPFTNVNIARV